MAYVPGCRHDVFISYARENNRDGWVDQFVAALGQELSELLGVRQFNPKDSIFFDTRNIEIAQSFPDELAAGARASAIFLPILSPGYFLSPWCNRERTAFVSELPPTIEPASRVAPVLIRPVEETGLDALHRKAQRISFLSPDEQTPLLTNSPEWRIRVCKFAGQLKTALQKLRRECKPVFIGKAAQTEPAQRLRDWCCAELERRHFRTLPEYLHVLDDAEAVTALLREAGIALHFLGGMDASAIAAVETSVIACAGTTVLYQPFGAELTATERLWLANFERQLETASGGYQHLAGKNDQELLAVIDELIGRVRPEVQKSTVQPQLALVCEKSDLDSVRRLQDEIRAKKPVEVCFPDFLGGRMRAMEIVRRWQEYLNRSDALLFYYGATERERLELIWQTAEQQRANTRRDWFLAPPDLETKRQTHPDALWNLDQVLHFVEGYRTTRQA